MGTGAGLPAIPLAIACPDVEVVALDSTAKKMAFVAKMAEELELPNLKPVVARAEELGHERGYREAFDAVVSRATANLPVLLELTVPFLRTAGFLFASKGSRADEEVDSALFDFLIPSQFESVIPISASWRHTSIVGARKLNK